MKHILKIILISFSCVIGAVGLMVGGFYFFGGFEQKEVYAENFSFNVHEVVSSEAFPLKVTTSTENVNMTKIKITVSRGGEDVVKIINNNGEDNNYIELNKTFWVIPVVKNGVNFGGNVTLTVSYDGEMSNQAVTDKCEVLIDVPIEKIDVKPISSTTPRQTIDLCEKGDLVNNFISIYPQKALIPYATFGENKITTLQNKVLFLELVDGSNSNPLTSEYAQFKVDNVLQNSNVISVNYSTKLINNTYSAIFDNDISIVTKNNQCDVKLNIYTYSTYSKQTENIREESVRLNIEDAQCTSSIFAVGDYQITDFNLGVSIIDVPIDLSGSYDDCVKLYLSNNNVNENDINLDLTLIANDENAKISDYYLLNFYITIDNYDYRLLFNNDNSSANMPISSTTEPLCVNFSGISDQKAEWCWLLSINDFLAYYNAENNDEFFTATITYKEYETNTANVLKSFSRSFVIRPKAEVKGFSVEYKNQNDTSYKIDGSKGFNPENDTKVNFYSSDTTFNDIKYYLSYSENNKSGSSIISTIPSTLNKNYKISFEFSLDSDCSIKTINPYGIVWYSHQSTHTIRTINGESLNSNVIQVKANEIIKVEMDLKMTSVPTNEYLFQVSYDINNVEYEKLISNFQVKFYEEDTSNQASNQYKNLPYLKIGDLKYNVDFNFVEKESNEKYLEIITNYNSTIDKLYQISGIGSFVLTIELVYDYKGQIYWLGENANVTIEVFQELKTLNVYCIDDSQATINYTGVIKKEYKENDDKTYYLFVTSDSIEMLKDYVLKGDLEVSFNQDFSSYGCEDYNGIRSINENSIVFGDNWIEVYENDVLIGYKISYKINEVWTISLDSSTNISPKFNINISIKNNSVAPSYFVKDSNNSDIFSNSLEYSIKDNVCVSSFVNYNSKSYIDESNCLSIIANISNGSLVYLDESNNTINFDNMLKYGFLNGDGENTTNNLTAEFTVEGSNIINITGLYSFVANENGCGGLSFKNIPYNENGIIVKMRVHSSLDTAPTEFNGYYLWDINGNKFDKTSNNLSSEIYFKIYGLKIVITENINNSILGIKNETYDIKDLFDISISKHKTSTKIQNIGSITNLLNIYVYNSNFTLNDTSLTCSSDLLENEIIEFKFYIGSSTQEENLIKIGSTYSCIKNVLTPFQISTVSSFDAPSENNVFATIQYKDANTALPNDFNYSISVKSYTLNNLYNIANPIIINSDKTLSFKAVPEDYTAKIVVTLTLGEKLTTQEFSISVNSIFDNDDITIGILDDTDVDNQFYYINAGETILVGQNNFSGGFSSYFNNISNIEAKFEDKETNIQPLVSSHMVDLGFNSLNKSFSFKSYDLNDEKTINIILTIYFGTNGKIILTKEIVVKPNLILTLTNNIIKEGNQIVLSNNNTYTFVNTTNNNAEFNISDDFNEEGGYSKNDFTYDVNVFSENIIGNSFALLVKNDASSVCEGKTTISFNYNCQYGNKKYVLVFDLEVVITFNENNDDLSIGTLNSNSGLYEITAGSENEISINNGIVFSSKLLSNFANITDVEINIYDNADNEMDFNQEIQIVSEELKDIKISLDDLSQNVPARLDFVFSLKNGQTVSYSKYVSIKANIELLSSSTIIFNNTFSSFKLNQLSNYTISKTNDEDFDKQNFLNNCVFEVVDKDKNTINTNLFTININKELSINGNVDNGSYYIKITNNSLCFYVPFYISDFDDSSMTIGDYENGKYFIENGVTEVIIPIDSDEDSLSAFLDSITNINVEFFYKNSDESVPTSIISETHQLDSTENEGVYSLNNIKLTASNNTGSDIDILIKFTITGIKIQQSTTCNKDLEKIENSFKMVDEDNSNNEDGLTETKYFIKAITIKG